MNVAHLHSSHKWCIERARLSDDQTHRKAGKWVSKEKKRRIPEELSWFSRSERVRKDTCSILTLPSFWRNVKPTRTVDSPSRAKLTAKRKPTGTCECEQYCSALLAHYVHNDIGRINAGGSPTNNSIHSKPSRSFAKSDEETSVSPKEMT